MNNYCRSASVLFLLLFVVTLFSCQHHSISSPVYSLPPIQSSSVLSAFFSSGSSASHELSPAPNSSISSSGKISFFTPSPSLSPTPVSVPTPTPTPLPSPLPAVTQSSSSLKSEDTFLFYLEDIKGKPGETVTVKLYVKNNPGIAGFSISVLYNPDFLQFEAAYNKIPGSFSASNSQTSGRVMVMCTKSGGNTITEDGLCFTVTMKIKDNAPEGLLNLDLALVDFRDTVFTFEGGISARISCTFEGCVLTVEK